MMYVIATGETHTFKELLHEVFHYAGLDVDKHVEIDERLFRTHEVPLLLGDPHQSKRKARLGAAYHIQGSYPYDV